MIINYIEVYFTTKDLVFLLSFMLFRIKPLLTIHYSFTSFLNNWLDSLIFRVSG